MLIDLIKPKRRRRSLKWVGLVTSLVLIVVWGLSFGGIVRYTGRSWTVGVGKGKAVIVVSNLPHESTGFEFQRPGQLFLGHLSTWWEPEPIRRTSSATWIVVLLWIPLLVVALPAAWLWWRGSSAKRPNHCSHCGYDRAGLAAGSLCPECGKQPEAR